MSTINGTRARAVADHALGQLHACVEIAAEPERVFQALTSKEITAWWVRPGVFDTREWTGDVRAGGRWRAAGISRGNRMYRRVSSSKSNHRIDSLIPGTAPGQPDAPSIVTYLLERLEKRNASYPLADRLRFGRRLQRVRDRMGNEPQPAR